MQIHQNLIVLVSKMFQHIIKVFKGLGLGTAVIILQFISFTACFIGSIFGAMGIVALIDYLWNFELPIFLVGLIQGLLLIRYARLHSLYQEIAIGTQFERAVKRNPISMGLIPLVFTLMMSLGAICGVFIQFNSFHIINEVPKTHPVGKRSGESTDVLLQNTLLVFSSDQGCYACLFILFLSYVIYNSAKVIQTELNHQLIALTIVHPREKEFPNLTNGFFIFCQFGLTIGYLIPLFYSYVIVNFLSVDRGTIFFYLSVIGAAMGFFASFLESKEPFPLVKAVPPLFLYERNVKSRVLFLKYGLLPYVYYYFFETSVRTPNGNGKEGIKNIADAQFLLFTMTFALVILQTVKILSVSFFIPRIMDRRRLQRRQEREAQAAAGNDVDVEFERALLAQMNQRQPVDNDVPNLVQDPTMVANSDSASSGSSTSDSTNNNKTSQPKDNILSFETETTSIKPKHDENGDLDLNLALTPTPKDDTKIENISGKMDEETQLNNI